MAKHRAGHPRRRDAQVLIPRQRGPRPVGITDTRTRVEHAVSDESVAQHRHSGRYLAVCGARVLAASRSAPDRGRCRECVIEVVSR